MGGKNKKKESGGGGKKGKEASNKSPAAASSSPGGPTRVLLLRHGQSEANQQGRDVPDPLLTDLGRCQASAWKGAIGRFGAEMVLVSPLRRAIQTALLAFEAVDVPIEICRHAREQWWDEKANTISTPEMLHELLKGLPRGDEVCGVEAALDMTDVPQSEHESIRALKQVLDGRPEGAVCVVCHWGVINALCGDGADNGVVVECRRSPKNGQLVVERHHDPPKAPRTR